MNTVDIVTNDRPQRNLFVRIVFGFLWLVLFYFITNILIGGIVGGIAGAHANEDNQARSFSQGFETGRRLGHQATADFFHKYGLLIIFMQILVFVLLCAFSIFPGVGKYKKNA